MNSKIISIILAFHCHALMGMEITPHKKNTTSFKHIPDDIRQQISTRLPKQHQQWWYLKDIRYRDTTKPLNTTTKIDSSEKLSLKISNPDFFDFFAKPPISKVQIFNAETQEEVATFPHPHDWSIDSACLNSQQSLLATGCMGNVRIFDIKTKQEICFFPHSSWGTEVCFDPSDKLIATTAWNGRDGTARIFNLETKEEIACFSHKDNLTNVCWSSSGNLLATACSDKKIRIFNTTNKEEIACFSQKKYVDSIHFNSSDTLLVALTGWGRNAHMYDMQEKTKIASFKYDGRICALIIDPAGKEFSTVTRENATEDTTEEKMSNFVPHHDYTPEQLNLKCLFTDWLLIEKPDKKIDNLEKLLKDVAHKHDRSYNELLETWETFPKPMHEPLLQTMLHRIQTHGK